MSSNSNVGENITAKNASWTFGGDVPKNFSNHVKRSVPFYDEGHDLICKISDFFVNKDSTCYELGVSTGALIKKLAQRHAPSSKWVGIDCERNMIEQASKEVLDFDNNIKNVELIEGDINVFEYEKSDLFISYYTIQFVPPRQRAELIKRIYDSLNWGGALLLFEKVRGPDARFQDILTSLYTDFKLEQGYSPTEIIAKSKSLKGVLEPFSSEGNLKLLKLAGFEDIVTVFKYTCFEGILAIK